MCLWRYWEPTLLEMLLGEYWLPGDSWRCMLAHTFLVRHLWRHRVESRWVCCQFYMGELPWVLSNKSLLWFKREWKTRVWSRWFTKWALLAVLLGKYRLFRNSRRCVLALKVLVRYMWRHREESRWVCCQSHMGEIPRMPSNQSWLRIKGRWEARMCLWRYWEPTLLEMLLGEHWLLGDSRRCLLAHALLVWHMRWVRIEPRRIYWNVYMGKLPYMLGLEPFIYNKRRWKTWV